MSKYLELRILFYCNMCGQELVTEKETTNVRCPRCDDKMVKVNKNKGGTK